MTIDQYFQTLTGFPPRLFQQQAIAHLLNRQDVLLRAPTGSGKTETAIAKRCCVRPWRLPWGEAQIAPFLFAKTLQCDFPNKLIYVVPLRTLANSLRQRAETLARTWETFTPPSRPLVVTLQTGENPEDPRFEGDIVFCTIDQMLSSFLNIPYSVGRGSANRPPA
jgi:CRISPR-associated endonuclease/helicase Cas3